MAGFFAEIATEVAWAFPVAAVLWFAARRFTTVMPSESTTATHPGAAGRPAWQRAAGLATAFALLIGLVIGLGWLVTSVAPPVRDLDVTLIEWLEATRTDAATVLAHVGDTIGDTPGIISMVLIAATVAHAVTRRWAPAFVVVAAAAGETSIFLAAQSVISRARPEVERLAADPATSSFPSGHVAATIATYGCIALLVLTWSRSGLRVVAVAAAGVVSLLVAWARLYQGMHFPSDVLASFVFAPLWLAACWWALRPGPRGERVQFGAPVTPRTRVT